MSDLLKRIADYFANDYQGDDKIAPTMEITVDDMRYIASMNVDRCRAESELRNIKQGGALTNTRKACEYRHDNGNCLKVGGFCTSVNDKYCSKTLNLNNSQDLDVQIAIEEEAICIAKEECHENDVAYHEAILVSLKELKRIRESASNDVCEWYVDNKGNYKCKAHAETYDSRVLDWNLCPYCGKKILCKE